MDYIKFLAAIEKINYATPEITSEIKHILYASIKAEIRHELIKIQKHIITLPSAPTDETDKAIFDKQMAQYEENQRTLIIRYAELEEKHPSTDSNICSPFLTLKRQIEASTQQDITNTQNRQLIDAQNQLTSNLINNPIPEQPRELSPKFIAEFAKPFRTIRHLQQTLLNAPPIIKEHEVRITLELLKHIKDERALQTQLEASPDTVLQQLIKKASLEYTELQKASADRAQLSQVQNLAHLATMILVKRHCEQIQKDQSTNGTETYINLLQTLTDLIPDVGASSIIDNVSDSTILKTPNIQSSETINITRMLYDAREKLDLNHKAWSDKAQMQIMAPSRHLFQRLRFGQEDRRIYAEIRRTNLESDLFMARNIYDIQQFTTDPDKTSDKAFEIIEQEHYEAEIKKRLDLAAESFLEKMFSEYYDMPEKFQNSNFYKESREGKYKVSGNPTDQEKETKKQADDIINRIRAYHIQKKDLASQKNKNDINSQKLKLLLSSYTMHNLEKIFTDPSQAADKLPCPQPIVTIDKNGKITVEINYFNLSALDVKIQQVKGMRIETAVINFMSSHGGTDVERGVFSGNNLTEILENIGSSSFDPKIKKAFSAKVNKFKKDIPIPRKNINDLNVTDNDKIAKIRKLLELKYFFDQYKKYLDNKDQENQGFSIIEQKLSTSFKHISNCEYDKAINTPDLDKTCCEAYTWISSIPENEIPNACQSTYSKSAKIAESAQQRMDSYRALSAALDIKDDPTIQKKTISSVFLKEYGPDSVVAQTVLDKEQSQSALADIDAMAEEYVDFSERTVHGECSITPDQEATYLSALEQISRAILHLKLKGTPYKFKLSHKIPVNQEQIVFIKDAAGNVIHKVHITINSKLPYSLSKSPNSDRLLLSYGGSRGTVAELQHTQKTRYFTGWRIYGIGQYGTVKRADDFVTGEGAIIKEGLVAQPGQASTYDEALRQDPLYRNMTSRDDPNSETERTVLEAIAAEKQTRDPSATSQIEYWTEGGKTKTMHTSEAKALRYKMIQPLAKGKSLKDTIMPHLNANAKGTPEFHHPPEINNNRTLEDALALSAAIVAKVEEYRALGFSHNDLKPENLMAFKRPNGTYAVDFIDWATGGFERTYVSRQTEDSIDAETIFKKRFGQNTTATKNPNNEHEWLGPKGQFLRVNEGQIIYGIKPNLEILHGSGRNCTLPYIAPNVVLGRNETSHDFVRKSLPAGTVDHHLDTNLDADQASQMDNWALTALSFGLTNRKAYFILAEGRAVHDYTVPGVINTNENVLEIENSAQFNAFFAPTDTDKLEINLSNLNNPDAAMFIPATLREGQPLHLYQRLEVLYKKIEQDQGLKTVKHNIKKVLHTVHTSITSGEGLSPEELKTQLKIATECLHAFEQKQEAQKIKQKAELLKQVYLKCQPPITEKLGFLLESCNQEGPNSPKNIEILCTYPTLDNVDQIVNILSTIPKDWLKNNILSEDAPVGSLLQLAITYHQPGILNQLLHKLGPSDELNQLITKQGLLHYALQEGMTDSAKEIIYAFKNNLNSNDPSSKKEIIFNLMLKSYGPGNHEQCPYITWNANALHTAIRNNDAAQLTIILDNLPNKESGEIRSAIMQAMYFSADLLNKEIFMQLWDTYNITYTDTVITAKDILAIRTPDVPGECPLHFFLSESEAGTCLPATTIIGQLLIKNPKNENNKAIRDFLMHFPYPSLIAAENHNFTGLKKLLDLAKIFLSEEDNQSLLQQMDLEGGNLLNHILKDKDPDLLKIFLNHPGMNPNILYTLLKNPDPNNPLRQFLSSDIAHTNPTFATQTLLTLLRSLGADPKKEESQRQVRNILLANREWLIQTANDLQQQQKLSNLLEENWWSLATKKSLLTELLSQSNLPQVAHTYLTTRLQAITSKRTNNKPISSLDINRQDFTDIHSQRGDFKILIEGLLANSVEHYKKMSEASEGKISELDKENFKLKHDLEILQNSFNRQKSASAETIIIHLEEKTKLNDEIKKLNQQIKDEKIIYTTKFDKLSGKTRQSKDDQVALTEKHTKALEKLNTELDSLRSQIIEKDLKISALDERILELTQLQETTKKALEKVTAELTESSRKLVDQVQLELVNFELKTELDEIKKEFKVVSENADKLVIEIKQKQKQLDTRLAENTLLKEKLQSKIKSLQEELDTKLVTIQKLKEKLNATDDRCIRLDQTLQQSVLVNVQLENDLKALREELKINTKLASEKETALLIERDGLQDTIAKMTKEAQTLDATILEQQQANQKLQASLQSVTEQLDLAIAGNETDTKSIQQLMQEKNQLLMQVGFQTINTNRLQNKIQELQTANQLITARYKEAANLSEELQQQLAKTNDLLKTKSQIANRLNEELQEARIANQRLEHSLTLARSEISSLGEQVNVLNIKVSNLNKTLQEEYERSSTLKIQLNKLEKKYVLDKIKQSTLHKENIAQLKDKLKDSLNVILEKTFQLEDYLAQVMLLREINSGLDVKNADLVKYLEAIDQLNKSLKHTIEEARAKESVLESKVLELGDRVATLEDQFSDTSKQLEDAKHRAVKLQQALEENSQRLHAEKQTTLSYAETNRDLTRIQDQLTEALDASQLEVFTISQRMQTIERSNNALLAQLSTQRSQFRERLETMRGAMIDSRNQATLLSEQLHKERLKNSLLEQALSHARSQISDLNAQVGSLQHSIKATTKELDRARETSAQLSEELLEVKGNLDKNISEQAKLRSDITSGAQDNAQLRERLDLLEESYTNLMQRQELLLKHLHVQEEKNEALTAQIQHLETEYEKLQAQYDDTTDENVVLKSLLTDAHNEIGKLRTDMRLLTRTLNEKDLKIRSLEEQLTERDFRIREIENQCQALHDSLQEQLSSGATPSDFALLRAKLEHMAQLYRHALSETDLLRQENAALHDTIQRQDAMKLRSGAAGGTAMRSSGAGTGPHHGGGRSSNISSVDDNQSDDEASDTDYNQIDEDDVDLVVENLGKPRLDLESEYTDDLDLTVTNMGKLNPNLRQRSSAYTGYPSKQQWPGSDSGHTTDADADSTHANNGGKSRREFFDSSLLRQSHLNNNPRRTTGSNSNDDRKRNELGWYNKPKQSNSYLPGDSRRRKSEGYNSDDSSSDGPKRERSKVSDNRFYDDSRRHRSKRYDSDDSSSDGPKRHRPKDSGRGYSDSPRTEYTDPRDIAALGARTEPARVRLHGRERELRDVQADIAIAIGNYAEIMSNRNPSDEDKAEVTAKKKILFVFQPEPVGLQIGYCSDDGDYVQASIEGPKMHTLLEEYRNPGDGVVLDPNHLQQISTYLTTTLGLAASPVKDPHPGLTNTISDRDQYVRLSAIDITDRTRPPKRLLDAKLNDVVVYRRLISDPGLTSEWKAQTILKSMGIPPQPQFDFPAALEIDGKTDIADFEADRTKNPTKHAVITRMFELYNEAKLRYDSTPPTFGP